jgi:hypothetical protein
MPKRASRSPTPCAKLSRDGGALSVDLVPLATALLGQGTLSNLPWRIEGDKDLAKAVLSAVDA